MQTLIASVIVAAAAMLLGVRVWRSWRTGPSCSCGTDEAERCHSCDGCERMRANAAYPGETLRESAREAQTR